MSGRGGCPRCWCISCGEEMIHRDNRRGYEASSAFNQILHREGPVNLTVGDVDTYSLKLIGNHAALRLLEHKQPHQALKTMQKAALGLIDQSIRHAAKDGLFGLTPDSGVFILRGPVGAEPNGHRKVVFTGPQIVETLHGDPVLAPRTRFELWEWLCNGPHGRLRDERW